MFVEICQETILTYVSFGICWYLF